MLKSELIVLGINYYTFFLTFKINCTVFQVKQDHFFCIQKHIPAVCKQHETGASVWRALKDGKRAIMKSLLWEGELSMSLLCVHYVPWKQSTSSTEITAASPDLATPFLYSWGGGGRKKKKTGTGITGRISRVNVHSDEQTTAEDDLVSTSCNGSTSSLLRCHSVSSHYLQHSDQHWLTEWLAHGACYHLPYGEQLRGGKADYRDFSV